MSICQPRISRTLALTEPEEELFVTQAARVVIQSIKTGPPAWPMARYRPRMRRTGQAKHHPDHHGAQATANQAMSRHVLKPRLKVEGGVGAHGHEGGRAQRDLPAVAHQMFRPKAPKLMMTKGIRMA